jgi:DNA-binding MarR family transcriptional regulator
MHEPIGHQVKCLHWLIRHTLDESLESMGLTGPQSFILRFISRQSEAPCIRNVEEKFGFSHATVCGVLSRLEGKEFIALRPDEKDRRIKRLYLLPRGEECLQRTCQTLDTIEEQMLQSFTPDEQAAFRSLLRRAIENMTQGSCCHTPKEETNP